MFGTVHYLGRAQAWIQNNKSAVNPIYDSTKNTPRYIKIFTFAFGNKTLPLGKILLQIIVVSERHYARYKTSNRHNRVKNNLTMLKLTPSSSLLEPLESASPSLLSRLPRPRLAIMLITGLKICSLNFSLP